MPSAIIFYDGTCALCHGFVRWVVARDAAASFQFAPLHGETFRRLVPDAAQRKLPDSVVVRDRFGELHTSSDAVVIVLYGLGRLRTASLLRLIPRTLRDFGYSLIARIRYAVFGRKQELCPMVPAELRVRFLD